MRMRIVSKRMCIIIIISGIIMILKCGLLLLFVVGRVSEYVFVLFGYNQYPIIINFYNIIGGRYIQLRLSSVALNSTLGKAIKVTVCSF